MVRIGPVFAATMDAAEVCGALLFVACGAPCIVFGRVEGIRRTMTEEFLGMRKFSSAYSAREKKRNTRNPKQVIVSRRRVPRRSPQHTSRLKKIFCLFWNNHASYIHCN